MTSFTESVVEDAALGWLESLGYAVLHLSAPQSIAPRQAGGRDIVAGMPSAEWQDYGQLHDTLLPKLISGELRAKEVLRIAEIA